MPCAVWEACLKPKKEISEEDPPLTRGGMRDVIPLPSSPGMGKPHLQHQAGPGLVDRSGCSILVLGQLVPACRPRAIRLLSAICPWHMLTPGAFLNTAPPAHLFPPAVPGNAASSPYTHARLVRSEKSPRLTYLTQQSLSPPALPSPPRERAPVIPFTAWKEEYIQDVSNPAWLPGSEKSSYYCKLYIHYLSNEVSAAGLQFISLLRLARALFGCLFDGR